MSFPKVMATTVTRCRELQQCIALLQEKPPIIIKGAAEQPYAKQVEFGQTYEFIVPGSHRPPNRSADPSPPQSRSQSSTDLLASLNISPTGYSGDSVISSEYEPAPPPRRSTMTSALRPQAEPPRSIPTGPVQTRQSYSVPTQRPRQAAPPSTPPPLESMT